MSTLIFGMLLFDATPAGSFKPPQPPGFRGSNMHAVNGADITVDLFPKQLGLSELQSQAIYEKTELNLS